MLARGGQIFGIEARWGLLIVVVLTAHFFLTVIGYVIGGIALPVALLVPAPFSVPVVFFVLAFLNRRQPDFARDFFLDLFAGRYWTAVQPWYRRKFEVGRMARQTGGVQNA